MPENQKKTMGLYIKRISNVILTMVKSILTTETFDDNAISKLEKAYELRESDYFDFLLGGIDVPLPKQVEIVAPEQQDIKYPEYSDEPTK